MEKKPSSLIKKSRGEKTQAAESRPGFGFSFTLISFPPAAPSSASAAKTQPQPLLDKTERETEKKKTEKTQFLLEHQFVKNGWKHFFFLPPYYRSHPEDVYSESSTCSLSPTEMWEQVFPRFAARVRDRKRKRRGEPAVRPHSAAHTDIHHAALRVEPSVHQHWLENNIFTLKQNVHVTDKRFNLKKICTWCVLINVFL